MSGGMTFVMLGAIVVTADLVEKRLPDPRTVGRCYAAAGALLSLGAAYLILAWVALGMALGLIHALP